MINDGVYAFQGDTKHLLVVKEAFVYMRAWSGARFKQAMDNTIVKLIARDYTKVDDGVVYLEVKKLLELEYVYNNDDDPIRA